MSGTPRAALLVASVALAAACSGAGPRALPPEGRAQEAGPVDYAHRIDSPAAWRVLAAKPDSEHLPHTEIVKIIFDRSTGRFYFQESRRWPMHYDFAERFLSSNTYPVPDVLTFNHVEYHSPRRRFILATITRHADADLWSLELFANDDLSLEATADLFHATQKLVYFSGRLRYRPVPPAHERNLARVRELMPVITTDELFGKVRYQPLELGEAYGYLKIFPPGERPKLSSLRPYDIIVLGDLPEDLPVVAGVISSQLQAPLGHINALCHNRRTPNMALRGATADPTLRALRDKLARLVVEGQSFRVEPATLIDAERSWAKKRPEKGFAPVRDDRDVGMPLLADASATKIALVGAKAAQLAQVSRVLPSGVVPKAFGLPFHAYARFLEVNGLGPKIGAMLASPAFRADPEQRRPYRLSWSGDRKWKWAP